MTADLRVALVHPWLTNQGGSERVLDAFCQAFPGAPVHTSVYDPAALPAFAGREVRTSFLQRWPLSHRHQLYPLLRRRAFEAFDLSGYDVVLTSDHCEAKGVLTGADTLHLAYLHTPTRYYWSDYQRYLATPGFGRLDPLVRLALPVLAGRMRQWDLAAAQRPDHLFANSAVVARRIEKYYRRASEVLHPPVDVHRFTPSATRGEHLVVVSRLIPYKAVDLVVQACAALDLPLRVVGDGPERPRLESLAGPRTTFVGAVPDEQVAVEYAQARAMVFPADEDFGLTPLEAMASGTPVLALGRGGATETVVTGVTGDFFAEQSVGSLVAALRRFRPQDYDPAALRARAEEFATDRFVGRLRQRVGELWQAWSNRP